MCRGECTNVVLSLVPLSFPLSHSFLAPALSRSLARSPALSLLPLDVSSPLLCFPQPACLFVRLTHCEAFGCLIDILAAAFVSSSPLPFPLYPLQVSAESAESWVDEFAVAGPDFQQAKAAVEVRAPCVSQTVGVL